MSFTQIMMGILASSGAVGQTFASLGYMGANITASSDYSQAYWFNNAALDGRGWGADGSTSAGGVPLDGNGYSTVTCTNVLSTPPTPGVDGQLAAGTYTNCEYTSAANAVLTTPGAAGVTISGVTPQGGGRYTFTMTLAPGALVIVRFSAGLQDIWIPRDFSSPKGTLPRFADAALKFYSQLTAIRTMGVTGTNNSLETSWSTRRPNYPAATGANFSNAASWETVFAFFNAVQAYPGSRFTQPYINLPALADNSYVTGLAALANSMLSPTLKPEFVELSNEVNWNTDYAAASQYFQRSMSEVQPVAAYAVYTVTSVVGNGTDATVTISGIPPAWATAAGTTITATNTTNPAFSSAGAVALTPLTGLTFSYPCTATGSMALTDNWIIGCGSDCIVVNVITSVVCTSGVVTVSMKGALPSWVTAANAAGIVTDGSDATWNVGTPAAPVPVTVTGQSTYTYPHARTNATLNLSDQWGMIFNTASTLVNDGLADYSLYESQKKYFVRALKTAHDAWVAIRPNSRFVLGLQLYGTNYPSLNLAGIMSSPSVHWAYACFLGGGIGAKSKASFSWIDSVAVAPYISVSGSNVTVDQLFEPTGAASTSLYYAINTPSNPTSLDKCMFAHRYMCNKYGAHAICYEGGVDLQSVSSLVTAANTDPRMGGVIKALADMVFQSGIETTFWLELTPGTFTNGTQTGGSGPYSSADQGGWPYLQSYADTSSPKFAAFQAYNTPVSYSNVNGAPGTLGLAHYLETTGGYLMGSGNCLHWYTGNGNDRYLGYEAAINTPGTWSINVWGTDVAACNVTVYVDEVLLGTMPLAVNGYGGNANGTASASPLSAVLTAGQRNIRVDFPAGVGNDPGVYQIVLTYLHQ